MKVVRVYECFKDLCELAIPISTASVNTNCFRLESTYILKQSFMDLGGTNNICGE